MVVTQTLNPQARQVVRTFAPGFGLEVVEVPHLDGRTDPEQLREAAEDAACVIFPQPNFFGVLEDAPALAAAANDAGALAVAHVDLMTLGVLEAPGAYGCAMAIGEGQSAGNYLSYGGPHYGFLAARMDYARQLPGRIVGETVDRNGERAYVLTLQTREQHIRREKATSNITSNQTLLALGGLVTLSWLGPQGLREVGERSMALAEHAKRAAGPAARRSTSRRSHEFCVRTGRPADEVIAAAKRRGVHPGYRDRPRLRGPGRRHHGGADREAHDGRHRAAGRGAGRRAGRGAGMKLIYERSQAGRRAGTVPDHGLPVPEVPEGLRPRRQPPRLPELAEPELVRHWTALSQRNFGIDTGFYPLGSCTMKYNPRVNERVVGLPGFRDLHPYQEEEDCQGALELMWRLQEILAEIVGLHAVTLQPAAGSQGELTGLTLMRAYFADRGELEQRREIVIPDTAHGTNPASVAMAGYTLVKVQVDERGNIDVDDLRTKVGPQTAGLMLTNPSTLGLFEEQITEIADIFHDAGALLYYDGANLNAVCGISRPGRHGLRHPALQPAQDVLAAARRRRPGRGLGRRARHHRAVPADAGRRPRRRHATGSITTGRSRSAACAGSAGRSACSCAPTRSSACGGRGCARCRRRPCSTPTTCWHGCATPTSCRTTATACTSSCSRRATSSASTASPRWTSPSG